MYNLIFTYLDMAIFTLILHVISVSIVFLSINDTNTGRKDDLSRCNAVI